MRSPYAPSVVPHPLSLESGADYLDHGMHWGGSTEWGMRNRLFALVEGASVFPRTRKLFGPDGQPIDLGWPLDAKRVLEVRLCGFNANRFLATMGEFEDLSGGTPSPRQRESRRRMLRQEYQYDTTPSLHLYLADSERIYDVAIRQILFASGQWLEIEMNQAPTGQAAANAFLDQPLASGGENAPLRLTSINLVPIKVALRLRDIFSLAHVPDADFTERQNGNGSDTPNPPKEPATAREAPAQASTLISDNQMLNASGDGVGVESAS